MNKKILIVCIFLICLSSVITHASTYNIPDTNYNYIPPTTRPSTIINIVNDANNFLGFPFFVPKLNFKNGLSKSLNLDVWNELRYQTMVYGNSFGGEKYYKGFYEPRYLGYTVYNEPYTNLRLPHDEFNKSKSLDERNWVIEPWKNQQFITTYRKKHPDYKIFKNEFDYEWAENNIEENIEQGMKDYYGIYVDGSKTDWYRNVHILQPPTWWVDGRGEAWHFDGSQYWYITVPIKAERFTLKIPDYRVVGINPGTTDLIEEGKTYSGTVTFGVNRKMRKPKAKARVTLKINGVTAIDNREIEIVKGKTLLIPFTYQGQAKKFTYTATITAVDPDGDTNLKNNTLTVTRYHKYIDIAATNLTSKSPIKINTPSTASVLIRNLGTMAATFTVNYYLENKVIKSEIMSLGRNGSLSRSFTFLSPNSPGTAQLKVTADPFSQLNDINRANNTTTKNISVEEYLRPPTTCNDQNSYKLTGKWNEVYYIIVGYPTRHYDITVWDDVKEEYVTLTYSYTDFSDPIWEPRTVLYTETLTASVRVNTKQGIPTDRNNPKESDRESRGSWEIIPWARSKGLDPNAVTRAGYGFEVTVDTTYWTDYETKMPRGLEGTPAPKGGTLYGPIKVKAEFWDTNNRFAGSYDLEPVSGIPGGKVIKWALPEVKRNLSNGTSFYDRKHYTDLKVPDGDYDIVISIEAVGKNGLKCCLEETVKIHGDMYDDIYTRPGT